MSDSPLAPIDGREVVHAAGGIVLRAADSGGWEVAVVHRPEHLDWTFPKGKLEVDESATDCALREVREETGYSCHLGRFVGQVEYTDRRGRLKVVSYWLMQPVDGAFQSTSEVDELLWPSLADAVGLLSYSHDRELLESVRTPLTKTTE
ncbi:MAG: NUDIX hydrolase [Acidimicrobiales bacterium]|jgi:8-oxo-dGTP diphosphatase